MGVNVKLLLLLFYKDGLGGMTQVLVESNGLPHSDTKHI